MTPGNKGNSKFLDVDGIATEEDAIRWSINAAVQRNRVYRSYDRREELRAEWQRMIREESQRYRAAASEPISDSQHCETIAAISKSLSAQFAACLHDGRLRFGTSQKAFNLYLKYLWHLNEIPAPPHCPIDRIVLDALGIDATWTTCDDQEQYMGWICAIRGALRGSLSIAEWENDIWLRMVSK